MQLTVTPAGASTLRHEDLAPWLYALVEELGAHISIAYAANSGSQPVGNRCHITWPVHLNGQLVAWLEVPQELRRGLGQTIVQALERAADARATIQDLAKALAETWKEINFQHDLTALLQEVVDLAAAGPLIVRQIALAKHLKGVSLYTVENGKWLLNASYPAGALPDATVAKDARAAIQAGEPHVKKVGASYRVCMPLMDAHQLVGALVLQDSERLGQAANLGFLAGAGGQIAHAIKLRRLTASEVRSAELRQSMDFAAEIQRGLLPTNSPDFAGARIAGACRASHIIAGDAFDYLPHTAGLDLLVADVSGHGAGAGLLMANFRGMLHTLDTGSQPLPKVAARINRYICSQVDWSGQYVTALLARLAVGGRKLSYVSMGHAPPVLWRAGKVTELSRARGLPAGFLLDETFEATSIALEAGDRVVLYTDGITETRNKEGLFFGLKGLRSTLASALPGAPEAVLEALFEASRLYAQHEPPDDDQTAIVIEIQ